MKHGQGLYLWANGSSYEGAFKNDKKHGIGTIIHENGKASKLEWEDGNVIKNLDDSSAGRNVFSATNIRNHNKSLPVNKKFLSREKDKQKDQQIINNDAFTRLKHSHSAVSTHIPKGISFRQTHNYQD